MSTCTIRTNNRPRDVLRWSELTAKEREQFDYLLDDHGFLKDHDISFVRYRGVTYDLSEFQHISTGLSLIFGKEWDGYLSDSFFSGVLMRWSDEGYDWVIMGTYFS